MPSSWTASGRLEKQFPGENISLWGDKLDVVLDRVDYLVCGWLTKALVSTPYSLTTANAGDDEARAAMLKFTGGAGPWVVQIPPVPKTYFIWNATTGAVTITTGSGATIAIDTGDKVLIKCDGANVVTPGYGGLSIKDYIAAAVLGATGSLPAVTGNAGKYVYTDGVSSFWRQPRTSDLLDYATAIIGLQVALAVAL